MKAFLYLFALGIFLHIHEGQAMCAAGFESFYVEDLMMEMCLNFVTDLKRDWHESKTYCKSLGADLADLDYGDLHWQVISYIHKHEWLLDEGFHIGCTDEVTENEWLWTDGRPVSMFTGHWYPGQPDGGYSENYGCLYYDDFLYSSCLNGQRLYAICMV